MFKLLIFTSRILPVFIFLCSFLFSYNAFANKEALQLANHYSGRIVNSELGDFMAKDINLYFSPINTSPSNVLMPENAYYISSTSYNNFYYNIGNIKTFNEGYNFRVAPLVEAFLTDNSSIYLLPFFTGGWHWFRGKHENNSFTNKTSSYQGGLTIGASYDFNKTTNLRQSLGIKTGFSSGNINYDSYINGDFQKYYSITANYIAELYYTIYAKFLPINIFSRYTYEYISGYTLSNFKLDDISENRLMFGLALSPTLIDSDSIQVKLMLAASYEYNFNNIHSLKNNLSSINTLNHNTKGTAVLNFHLPLANEKSISFDLGFSQYFQSIKGSTIYISISYGYFDYINNKKQYQPNIKNTNKEQNKNNTDDTEIIKK